MDNEKYSNYPLSISAILGLIEANDIAIPEIQRGSVSLSVSEASSLKPVDLR